MAASVTNEELRTQVDGIIERVKKDQDFARNLATDPKSTLVATGLSAEGVEAIFERTDMFPSSRGEVQGYSVTGWLCCVTIVIL